MISSVAALPSVVQDNRTQGRRESKAALIAGANQRNSKERKIISATTSKQPKHATADINKPIDDLGSNKALLTLAERRLAEELVANEARNRFDNLGKVAAARYQAKRPGNMPNSSRGIPSAIDPTTQTARVRDRAASVGDSFSQLSIPP